MALAKLDKDIIACEACPRLIQHCKNIAEKKRKSYMDWDYWGKPVPNFGVYQADLLIVGLAPAAHGANRTGRMFTGDRSGDWLYKALHKAGFANQPESSSSKDGLKLKNCIITAVAHCAPPDNKPTKEEVANCRPFLLETFKKTKWKVILCLGSISWKATLLELKEQGLLPAGPQPKFGHGVRYTLTDGRFLMGSYHPSQQNTFTKRLTEPMFDKVFKDINRCL